MVIENNSCPEMPMEKIEVERVGWREKESEKGIRGRERKRERIASIDVNSITYVAGYQGAEFTVLAFKLGQIHCKPFYSRANSYIEG